MSFVANLFLQIVVFHLLPDQFFVCLLISCSPYPHTSLFGKECGSSREMWGLDSYYLSMMISCWDYPHESLFGKECGSSREMWGLDSYYLSMMISCWDYPHKSLFGKGCMSSREMQGFKIHTTVAQGQLQHMFLEQLILEIPCKIFLNIPKYSLSSFTKILFFKKRFSVSTNNIINFKLPSYYCNLTWLQNA